MPDTDVIVFLVDGREGLTATDRMWLICCVTNKPLVLAVNKIDTQADEPLLFEFYNLAMETPYPFRSHKRGPGDLLDEIVKHFDRESIEDEDDDVIRIVVGKPNAGKSSIVNRILVRKEPL